MATTRAACLLGNISRIGASRATAFAAATRVAGCGRQLSTFAFATPSTSTFRVGSAGSSARMGLRWTEKARLGASQVRTMFIQTETTPNEDSLKFLPGQQVMESGTAEFLDNRSSMSSPLAKRLFGIQGVRGVFYGPDFVTVSKDTEVPWPSIKPEIYSTLMEFFTAGTPLFADPSHAQAATDTQILDTDSEVVAMIKELLDTRVRPAIQEDGGDIEYRGFEEHGDGIVRLMLKGSCRGCDSSVVTLKTGIERMLTHYIPEVKGVEQVLDQEELVALDEFSKLEKRLEENRDKSKGGMEKHFSV